MLSVPTTKSRDCEECGSAESMVVVKTTVTQAPRLLFFGIHDSYDEPQVKSQKSTINGDTLTMDVDGGSSASYVLVAVIYGNGIHFRSLIRDNTDSEKIWSYDGLEDSGVFQDLTATLAQQRKTKTTSPAHSFPYHLTKDFYANSLIYKKRNNE